MTCAVYVPIVIVRDVADFASRKEASQVTAGMDFLSRCRFMPLR